MRFKLEDNVPEIYTNTSRDFQLLCRVIDVYLCGCINRASGMINQLDLDNCSEDVLWAIAYMQGFTTKNYIPPNVLRNICKVFPWCIKRKGTAEAIQVASYAVLSVDRLITDIQVTQVNAGNGVNEGDIIPYSIYIECSSRSAYQSTYLKYLDDVLEFLLPTGYIPVYNVLKKNNKSSNTDVSFNNFVSYISGITGRVMGSKPISVKQEESETINELNGDYSRIGYSKVISSDSNYVILNQQHISGIHEYTSKINLISRDSGKSIFAGFNSTSDTENDGGSN